MTHHPRTTDQRITRQPRTGTVPAYVPPVAGSLTAEQRESMKAALYGEENLAAEKRPGQPPVSAPIPEQTRTPTMKRSEAFPSKYLSKDDVNPPRLGTIDRLKREVLKSDEGDETKTVLYFREEALKPMILNTTNWMLLEDAYGDESDNWLGKKVEIYHDPSVMFGGKRVGGVRVRLPGTFGVTGGNGSTPIQQTSKLWQRWDQLITEAKQLNVPFPALDPASEDADVIAAGKKLAAEIEAVKAF